MNGPNRQFDVVPFVLALAGVVLSLVALLLGWLGL